MKLRIPNAKIACLDINLMKTRMALGVHVVVDDPEQLEAIRKREYDITIERVRKILNAGANVVLTTKGIDDLCLKEFVEAGALAVRRCKKEDLRRIAKATGASLVSSLANLEGEETFESSMLGQAEEVVQEKFGDDECILVKGTKVVSSSSIVLRGANGERAVLHLQFLQRSTHRPTLHATDYMLDEMERSLHDALCIIKRTLESGYVVPGGGAVETALSIYLENFATTLGSREQLAIGEFAAALLVIPKTLAVNAAKDSTDLVAKLRAYHNAAQSAPSDDPKRGLRFYGLDLFEGTLRDNLSAGVLEPTMSKVRSLKSALEAATSLLRYVCIHTKGFFSFNLYATCPLTFACYSPIAASTTPSQCRLRSRKAVIHTGIKHREGGVKDWLTWYKRSDFHTEMKEQEVLVHVCPSRAEGVASVDWLAASCKSWQGGLDQERARLQSLEVRERTQFGSLVLSSAKLKCESLDTTQKEGERLHDESHSGVYQVVI